MAPAFSGGHWGNEATMAKRSCLAIILAAGEGTRMKSAVPKVLHKVAGLPMVGHVARTAKEAGATAIAVVVGPDGGDAVGAFVQKLAPGASIHQQAERLGTAHAVLAAKKAIAEGADDVIVLYGDTPLVTPATLARVRKQLAAGSDVVVVGFRTDVPTGYGRLVEEKGRLAAIVEEKDATAEQKRITLCNAGIIAFRGGTLLLTLKKIGNDNAQKQYYLTDAVAIANAAKQKVTTVEVDGDEVAGVNDRQQLAHVEGLFQKRAREAAMAKGATLIAPSTVWLSHDTAIGRDVTIEPNVFFGPGVTIADGVTIRANSHIEGATIAAGAIVGPFARLRPGADIGAGAHVGNFVEIKNAVIGAGAKANHLAYIGDADVGARTNVGAGTITCNYDGFDKHRTIIGEGVFIGSNTSLVAPVSVGDQANIAAGSVITHDIAPDAMAIARARQEDKPGWAKKYREYKALAGKGIERKPR
jgi:bifunctional UDP-N-acetylglucosamine pyrophosphorylase/glucosamine-1-phosphate N-acetyltransferase